LADPAQYKTLIKEIKRGDIIGANGFVGSSIKGELSLFVNQLEILTRCCRDIPKIHYGLKDDDERAKNRGLDMLVNPDTLKRLLVRSQSIQFIRNYLLGKKFVEVDTPVLCGTYGGANAKPFTTYFNDLKTNFFLRISPELYLKELIMGGMCSVFEIGPQFRNESIDNTHNPEFLSLELYQSFADYNHMLKLAEEMISSLVLEINKSYLVKSTKDGIEKTIDFTPPFARIDMIETLEKETQVIFPTNYFTEEANKFLDDLCVKYNIECGNPRTTPRLIDKLVGHFIEPSCVNPTFVMHHPVIMSPLAKEHREKPHLTERFELFINGFEVSNAYTELNDPFTQLATFNNQALNKKLGDLEAQEINNHFIKVLEYGLPPTGGFGLGIERLIMLLTDTWKISNVIYFPTTTPE
jgi:lysyl-tRNA synthetase class 2